MSKAQEKRQSNDAQKKKEIERKIKSNYCFHTLNKYFYTLNECFHTLNQYNGIEAL